MIDLQKSIAFIQEIDKLKSVYRRALIKSDDNRRENTAEHSWHVAMMALTFKDYSIKKLDMLKVIKMLLIHDIVEIYAGDTFAFGSDKSLSEQYDKELKALDKIFSFLPEKDSQELRKLWIEFEEAVSAEAIYSKAIEKSAPVFQNMQNDGGSWSQNKVAKEKVLKRNEMLKTIAPKLWDYVEEQINIAYSKGWLV
jgi:putative hydrolases of HD superfamily